MRIKKYNESLEIEDIDLDIVDQSFSHFIDEGSYTRKVHYNDNDTLIINIKMDDNRLPTYLEGRVDAYIENSKWLTELYSNVKNCLDKLKIEYDIMYINFSLNDNSQHKDDNSYLEISILLEDPDVSWFHLYE